MRHHGVDPLGLHEHPEPTQGAVDRKRPGSETHLEELAVEIQEKNELQNSGYRGIWCMPRLSVAGAACLLLAALVLPRARAAKHHDARSSLAYHHATTLLCGAVADHKTSHPTTSTSCSTAAALGQRGDAALARLCDLAREDDTGAHGAAAVVVVAVGGRPWADEAGPSARAAAPASPGRGGLKGNPPLEDDDEKAGGGARHDSPPYVNPTFFAQPETGGAGRVEAGVSGETLFHPRGEEGSTKEGGAATDTAPVDVGARADAPAQDGPGGAGRGLRDVVGGVGGGGGGDLIGSSGGTATTLAEAQAMLATAVKGVMLMIDVVGGTLAWTCSSYSGCSAFTVPSEISVTLRGVLGAGGKRPILDAQGTCTGTQYPRCWRMHIYNQGTLVLENLELTRGYNVRSCVCFSVTVGSACACVRVW